MDDIDIDGSDVDAHEESAAASATAHTAEADARQPQHASADDAAGFAYPEPSWLDTDLQQTALQETEMDPQSRALIESMLAEEAHYFGHPTGMVSEAGLQHMAGMGSDHALDINEAIAASYTATSVSAHTAQSKRPKAIQPKKPGSAASAAKPAIRVPASSQGSRSRWSDKEDAALLAGIAQYGWGEWKAIAAQVGTRTAKQAVNHARHLLLQGVPIPGAPASEAPRTSLGIAAPPDVPAVALPPRVQKHADVDEDIDIDITDDSDDDFLNGAAALRTAFMQQAGDEDEGNSSAVLSSGSASAISGDGSAAAAPHEQTRASDAESLESADDDDGGMAADDYSDQDDDDDYGDDHDDGTDHGDHAKRRIAATGGKTILPSHVTPLLDAETKPQSRPSLDSTPQDTHSLGSTSRPKTEPILKLESEQHKPELHGRVSLKLRMTLEKQPQQPQQPQQAQLPSQQPQTQAQQQDAHIPSSHECKQEAESGHSVNVQTEQKAVSSTESHKSSCSHDGGDEEGLHQDSNEPHEDFSIDMAVIKPFEMEFCPEWFLTAYSAKRANKTPERYTKIRNNIINLWHKMKPAHVSKSRIRPGLKGEGDVNAISRVHTFLDMIGAINVGAVKRGAKAAAARAARGGSGSPAMLAAPRNSSSKKRKPAADDSEDDDLGAGIGAVYEGSRGGSGDALGQKRRRRVRAANGEWVWEMEGTTIEHVDPVEEERRKLMQKNAKYFADEELDKLNVKRPKRVDRAVTDVMGKYDPFKLIPLRKYEDSDSTALRVKVHSNTLVVMDFHAHLAHTEIIGLLGGTFNAATRELSILQVFPCNSISTGVQCEMDPVSEMQARECFNAQGLDVVGWYHSHPTFEPNPSIRDIENQANYQALFRRQDGVEPFVGVIVSPYDTRTPVLISRFQFITVSNEWNSMNEYRIPFACLKSIEPSATLPPALFAQIADLVKMYRTHSHLVDLSRPLKTRFTTSTRIEKLIHSLESHIILGVNEIQAKGFLDRVRSLVERGLMSVSTAASLSVE
ncbi:hypothetical protein BC831DRAFT_452151 [Entophlyctis helioformis]|nr:hypothetical protein BC831DRAFT_452151 [Entophlyctis helioformis]